jgi:branched-chain amino acid transport system substrate-binding protein
VIGGAGAHQRGRVTALIGVVALACALQGCGGGPAADKIHGKVLTIYSSGPMEGASASASQAVLTGERLALAIEGGRIGRYRVVLKALDDATAQRGGWDPGQTTIDARLATTDRTTIGYLGEFDSGASAISIPLLNRAGIAQVSPTSSAVGLTSSAPGAAPGEPQKYYPTGERTFARVVPSDSVQAAAQVRLQRSEGCAKTLVLDDGQVDGSDAAASFQLAAQSAQLPLAGALSFDPRATTYTSLAAAAAQTGADCVLISAATESHAALVTEQVAAALPHAIIFGTAGLAESAYADPARGGVPAALDPRIVITAAALSMQDHASRVRAFITAYERRYGAPEPYAICGYEAMSLMLSALARATRNGTRTALRSKVVRAIFSTRDRRGALGTYSIQRDGDTTLRTYGVYGLVAGRLELLKAIEG